MIVTCLQWLAAGEAFILVGLAEVAGSTPRDRDAVLAVSATSVVGTIGGGRLEWDAIQAARSMLAEGLKARSQNVALGPDIGQCCGGRVTLFYQLATRELVDALVAEDSKAKAARPVVHIYGAGHVGRALAHALAPLPLSVQLIDSRAEELALFQSDHVKSILTDSPAVVAGQSTKNAAHVVMTHSHSMDSLIAAAILERGDFRYLGIIGSKTKRMRFRKAFQAMGFSRSLIEKVVCPIGGGRVTDKRPEIIAALTSAEIVTALFTASPKDA